MQTASVTLGEKIVPDTPGAIGGVAGDLARPDPGAIFSSL